MFYPQMIRCDLPMSVEAISTHDLAMNNQPTFSNTTIYSLPHQVLFHNLE